MVPENLRKEASASKNAGLNSARGDPEDLRGLVDGKALEVYEDDSASELLRDLLEGRLDVGPYLGRFE